MRFRASKTSLTPPPPPPPHTHTHPVAFLRTVPRRFLCCSSLFARRWFPNVVSVALSLSVHLSFLVPREGCASWLWHFLGIFTYIFLCTIFETINTSKRSKNWFYDNHNNPVLNVFHRVNRSGLTLSYWINKDVTPTSNFQPIGSFDPACWYKFAYLMANSVDPDQLASAEANWSGSILFAKAEHMRVQQD